MDIGQDVSLSAAWVRNSLAASAGVSCPYWTFSASW